MSLLRNFKPRLLQPLTPPAPFVESFVLDTQHVVSDADGNLIATRMVKEPCFRAIPRSVLAHENETADMYSIENQIANGFDLSEIKTPYFKQTIDDAESVSNYMASLDYDSLTIQPTQTPQSNETTIENSGKE